ncbi:hypothetical protein [Xanthocytophaga flava]|uniref:hypothetical protein n=1 Tax=Xanthocytophaga flava TaxID=3048013 RepID=UPI0028D26C8A|nr:hypothetical protein [Xanthocytophaga flavus]MDJ1470191.1 hypothetical protein [Xanthocytophaga flavus]
MLLDSKNHSKKLFIRELLDTIECIEMGESAPECMFEVIENAQILIETNDTGFIRDRFLYDLSQINDKMLHYQKNPSAQHLLGITNPVYVILESFLSRFVSE